MTRFDSLLRTDQPSPSRLLYTSIQASSYQLPNGARLHYTTTLHLTQDGDKSGIDILVYMYIYIYIYQASQFHTILVCMYANEIISKVIE